MAAHGLTCMARQPERRDKHRHSAIANPPDQHTNKSGSECVKMPQTLYPRGTVKKIVKAHANRALSKNVDILVRATNPHLCCT
jgi:hypothetical protein